MEQKNAVETINSDDIVVESNTLEDYKKLNEKCEAVIIKIKERKKKKES